MTLKIGRIVHYVVSESDAESINRRRTTIGAIAQRIESETWPLGAQAHVGNPVRAGEVYPLVVTRVWGGTSESLVNGQLLLDGTDVLWLTSVGYNADRVRGTWHWPHRES